MRALFSAEDTQCKRGLPGGKRDNFGVRPVDLKLLEGRGKVVTKVITDELKSGEIPDLPDGRQKVAPLR